MLQDMNDVAVVEVYLKGKKLQPGFQRLHDAVKERLESFRSYAGTHLVYRFTDPFEGKTEDEKGPIYQQLADKGITGVMVNKKEGEGDTRQIVFPWALVKYKGGEMPVQLLENHLGMSPLEILNYSESQLEFKLANAIHKLSLPGKMRVAYVMGQGEPLGITTYDALTTLAANYDVDTLDLPGSLYIPKVYNAIIINKPTQTFDEKDKFKIDQYVMHGGSVLWLVDPVMASMDSLATSQQFMTVEYNLNLDDMLFRYGARVNPDLVEDMQCNQIPVVSGINGDGQPQYDFKNWVYFPVFTPSSHHPIVNNMDAIMGTFVSSIDTIAAPEIKKTILLQSSAYSRTTPSPARISLAMLKFQPRRELFNRPDKPVAVLLEGKFRSAFNNRMDPRFLLVLRDSLKMPFVGQADSVGKMIVVSDGDMIQNGYSKANGPYEMGFWQYAQPPVRYANKSFFINCMEYLTDNNSLLEARTKETRLRLLDAGRAVNEETQWQFVNIGIPVILVLVFGSVYFFIRKRRYEGA
jgi:gliding-associated putative ABC transporter substrate-binding component GldG